MNKEQSLFTWVKSQVRILDVVSEYVTLKRAGSYWKGLSPFKAEKTASFTVSPHKEIFYCFSSSFGGDVITFIARIEQCTPLEAAHHLIERYNLTVPEDLSSIRPEKQSAAKAYKAACALFARWCRAGLKQTASAQEYLASRGISPAVLETFEVGVCPTGTRALQHCIQTAHKEHIALQTLIDAHLIRSGRQGHYTPFEGRIIFPISDHLGTICGFGGRVYLPDDTRPKYYNSQEHAFFAKSGLLFGLSQAKRSVQEHQKVILVEGYLDCLAAHQAGLTHTVATLGTACGMEHIMLLARYARTLVLLYDGDKAGEQAMLRVAQLCWHHDLDVRVAELPQGEDPASLALKDPAALIACVEHAKDAVNYLVERRCKDFGTKTLSERADALRDIVRHVATVTDTITRTLLIEHVVAASGVARATIQQLLAAENATQHRASERHTRSQVVTKRSTGHVELSELAERAFVATVSCGKPLDTESYTLVKAYIAPTYHPLVDAYFSCAGTDGIPCAVFLEHVEQEHKQLICHACSVHTLDTQAVYESVWTSFRQKAWRARVADVRSALAEAERRGDKTTIATLLQEFSALQKHMTRREA